MNTINQQLTENLKWLFSQSIFIKISDQEIHHLPLVETFELAKTHGIPQPELQHLLHLLCLSLLSKPPITGFIELLTLVKQIPKDFFRKKEAEQIEVIYNALCAREHHQEVSLSRFAFANPYVICWLPESEARVLEQA
jgi:hypothetical protein